MSGSGHGHAHGSPGNRRVALLISVLAMVLAFSETLGKSAPTAALTHNIETSNLWSFFTEMVWLIRVAGGLGIIGMAFCTIGFFAPNLVHVF